LDLFAKLYKDAGSVKHKKKPSYFVHPGSVYLGNCSQRVGRDPSLISAAILNGAWKMFRMMILQQFHI